MSLSSSKEVRRKGHTTKLSTSGIEKPMNYLNTYTTLWLGKRNRKRNKNVVETVVFTTSVRNEIVADTIFTASVIGFSAGVIFNS